MLQEWCGTNKAHVTESASALQLATEVWHICEQTRSACGPQLGDIIISVQLGGGSGHGPAAGQPGLAVAVAAASSAVAMRALQQIVQLAIKLG